MLLTRLMVFNPGFTNNKWKIFERKAAMMSAFNLPCRHGLGQHY